MPQNLVFEVSDCRFFFENPGKSLGTGRQQKLEKSFESFAFSGRSGAQKCFKPRGWAAVGWGAFSAPFFRPSLFFLAKRAADLTPLLEKKQMLAVWSVVIAKKGSLKSLLKHLHIGHGSKSLVSGYIVANIWVEA